MTHKHDLCLRLGLVPIYDCPPWENNEEHEPVGYVRGTGDRAEARAIEKLQAHFDSFGPGSCRYKVTGVWLTEYEVPGSHWSTGVTYVDCFIAETVHLSSGVQS